MPINLRERFGDRFRISFDPAHTRKADPWMMLLTFRGGNIYPHGGQHLAIEIEGRRFLRAKLAAYQCIQDGDDFQAFRFHVDEFDAVAAIVRPHRRRTGNAGNLLAHQYRSRSDLNRAPTSA